MPLPSGVRDDRNDTRVPRKQIAHPITRWVDADAEVAEVKAALAALGGSRSRTHRSRSRNATMLTKDAVERNLLAQMRLAGVPAPTHGPDTNGWRFNPRRRWRIDFAWTDRQPVLAVEVEGGSYPIRRQDGSYHAGRHVTPQGYENDCIKYSEAALAGVLLLRVTTAMVCDQQGRPDGRALTLLLRALEKTKPAVPSAGVLSCSVPD